MDDVLIYALFPQIALNFLKNKITPPRCIRTIPGQALRLASSTGVLAESTNDVAKAYSVSVKGQVFEVEVAQNGELTNVQAAHLATGQVLNSPLAGNIFKVLFRDGDVVIIVEAMKMKMKMKMEMEIRASISGLVSNISTKQGDAVQTGQPLLVIG